jgi:hypothetical protein
MISNFDKSIKMKRNEKWSHQYISLCLKKQKKRYYMHDIRLNIKRTNIILYFLPGQQH